MTTPTIDRFLLIQKKTTVTDAEVDRITDAGFAALKKKKPRHLRKSSEWTDSERAAMQPRQAEVAQ